RRYAELLPYTLGVADLATPAIDLDDAVVLDALREILVGRPDADLLDARVGRGEVRRRRERVVGLELDHRPDDDAHRGEPLLERVELPEQRPLHALGGLVAGPEAVAERLDDVVGRDAHVRRAALEHLGDRMEDAGDGAERRVGALRRTPRA